MALVTGSYLYAISKIQVAATILIQYLAPIFVAIFSKLFWKEQPTFLKITAFCLAFGGCFLVVGGYNLEILQINLLGILGGYHLRSPLQGIVCWVKEPCIVTDHGPSSSMP